MEQRWCAPVGTTEERASAKIWPGSWEDANPYLTAYSLGIHTGADLNLNKPHFDSDAHAGVYSIGKGTVLYAGRPAGSTSGNVIIVDYSIAAGVPLYARYWHVENMLVEAYANIEMGQQIASVGNAFGTFPYHLHFDLSYTRALMPGQAMKGTGPTHWPGANKQGVIDNYLDPKQWLINHVTAGEVIEIPPREWFVTATIGLKIREQPGTSARQVGSLKFRDSVIAEDRKVQANDYWWMRISSGPFMGAWIAKARVDGSQTLLSELSPPPPVIEVAGPPVGTRMFVAAQDGLRLRDAPGLASNQIAGLPKNTQVMVTGKIVQKDSYDWLPVKDTASGFAAWRTSDKKTIYLIESAAPPLPDKTEFEFGLHVHQGSPDVNMAHSWLLRIAEARRLQGAMVINDIGLCNALAERGVPYVVYRPVFGDGDAMPAISGTEADIQVGRSHWMETIHQSAHQQLHRNVYVQMQGCNEQNRVWPTHDSFFYKGAGAAAFAQNRHIVYFGDAIGHPADAHFEGDVLVSPTWEWRVKSGCMREGKFQGHLMCYHGYGRMVNGKETDDPGSELWYDQSGNVIQRDDEAWKWFAGRHLFIYREYPIPEDSRMLVILGEAGPSDAIYRGSGPLINDSKGYMQRLRGDPYTVAFCYWTVGGAGAFKFGYSTLDASLPDLYNWLVTVPR